LHSAQRVDVGDELLRRFVEAARRAQLVTIVNLARSEAELGELFTAEVCEAFEAEVAFVLAARDGGGVCTLVGAYGLTADQRAGLPNDARCVRAVTCEEPQLHDGDLLGVAARELVLVPFAGEVERGVVGVGRLYDQPFDEAEVALLEAVVESVKHALERIRLGHERDVLYAREQAARREAERLYREAEERGQAALALGYIADGVFLVDDNGTVQLWNRAAEAITGVRAEAAVGRAIDETIPGWDALAQGVTIASPPSKCRGRATTLPVEIRGRELWLSVTGVSFAEGTVYAFRDLTEERRLEELKADFVATVSHELRTPIAAVHGAAKTLQREDIVFTDDLRRHLLAVISDQSDRLVQLVNDILVTSQVESGRLVLAREQIDVTEVARGIIEAARTHAPEELSLELTAPRSLAAVTDRDKLRQVLANLVANAIKYSRRRGRVEVRLEQHRNRLRVAVRDEGVGIPQPEQQRIFEKFYRLDPNMTGGVSGTGLGLYICRELVRRMGGSIWVESSEGSGSTFFVELPVASTSIG
jgi:PAS domain S-box-containing protein